MSKCLYQIYKIVNTVDDKVYVGCTKNTLLSRLRVHKQDSRKSTSKLAKAIQNFGADKFRIELLEEAGYNKKEALEREKYWVETLDSFYNGYNSNLTGHGGLLGEANGMFGRTHTEEVREFLSKINKGKKLLPEIIEKIRLTSTGRVFSEESRKKKSDSLKGRVLSDVTKSKISIANKGRVRTDEFRAHQRNIRLGKRVGAENPSFKGLILCVETGDLIEKPSDYEKLGFKRWSVSRVLNGKLKRYKGYTFIRLPLKEVK